MADVWGTRNYDYSASSARAIRSSARIREITRREKEEDTELHLIVMLSTSWNAARGWRNTGKLKVRDN